jgi:hypothetical protein
MSVDGAQGSAVTKQAVLDLVTMMLQPNSAKLAEETIVVTTKAPLEEDEEFDSLYCKELVFECFTDEVVQ